MDSLNYSGIIIGIATILIIWFGRYACIKGEYFFTKKLWYVFIIIGIISVLASLFTNNIFASAILSIFGFTFLWGIHEIIEQEERVLKGWFPKRNKKKE
jgi:hypothetical protein